MRKVLALIFMLPVMACDPPKGAEPGAAEKASSGEVALMATAPDGTKLWAVQSMGRTIYFASSGTSALENCGKSCWRETETPTAN